MPLCETQTDERAGLLVQTTIFDTAERPRAERYDAWQSLIGTTHDILGDASDFSGRVVSTALGGLVVRTMDSDPQAVSRSARRCRRDGLDHITLHLTTAPFAFETSSSHGKVGIGAVTVNTLARPFQREVAPEKGSSILTLTRDLVTEVIGDPEAYHGATLGGLSGLLFRTHMAALCANARQVRQAEAPAIARATAHLLAAALVPTRATLAQARPAAEAAALLRCKTYIERNLRAPDLSPATVCRDVGLSRSALYRLFQPSGGAAAYIRERRLAAVARALSAATGRPRIADVAYGLGFTNLSTFNRLFREAFGMAPGEMVKSTGPASLHQDWMRTFS